MASSAGGDAGEPFQGDALFLYPASVDPCALGGGGCEREDLLVAII